MYVLLFTQKLFLFYIYDFEFFNRYVLYGVEAYGMAITYHISEEEIALGKHIMTYRKQF